MNQQTTQKPTLDVHAAAALVKRGPETIRRLVNDGYLTAYQAAGSRKHLFYEADVPRAMEARQADFKEAVKRPRKRKSR